MDNDGAIRCRVAACRESLGDGKTWSFYLFNDSAAALELVELHEVGYEWGDVGDNRLAEARVAHLAPRTHALIWRDDDDAAELRVDLLLHVKMQGRAALMRFEFPKLYLLRDLPLVDGLGKPGWVAAAESTGR